MNILTELTAAPPALRIGDDSSEADVIAWADEAFQAYDREEAEAASRSGK